MSWRSSKNAVFEAVDKLRENKAKVGAIHFTELMPLPEYEFLPEMNYYTVESNATVKLEKLLRIEYNINVKNHITCYNGLPLDHEYIIERFLHG